MSLRRQLITLFAALTVVPLLLVGLLDYVRSIKALEDVIASNTAVIAAQAAVELEDRYSGASTNLALFAENTAAVAMFDGATRTKKVPDSTSLAYLQRLHDVTRKQFAWIVYRDTASSPVMTFDDDVEVGGSSDNLYVATLPVRDARGHAIGRVDAAIRMDSIYPRSSLDTRFGRGGRTAVFDATTGFFISAGAGTTPLPSLSDFRPTGDSALRTRRLSYRRGDTSYIASMAVVPRTPFAVVSLGDVAEFSGPFGRIRGTNLLIVVLITATVAVLFLLALWRATRALSELTVAADAVGHGNFSPQLPSQDTTEVGRLATAFAIMTGRLRDTIAEVERGRRLAVIGEFASQVSHEIRNPLTSIKLNMQTLERAADTGVIPRSLAEPVEISLREVNRLDRVVRGVLQLGRGRVSSSATFALHDAVAAAAESMRLSFERTGIALSMERRGNGDLVRGDRVLLESAFLNILRNASEAMPNGGTIRVASDDATVDGRAVNRVRIEDRGPGVAVDDRERIFSPFFTTKADGSGLGLALAHRTIEEHHGRLWVEEPEGGGPGAAFVVELPGDGRRMTRRILIVDDDRSIRETLLGHFTRSGIDASAVDSAEAALSRLAALDPDLLLTDVRMSGMDGLALLALVRERTPDVDVVVMTAFEDMKTAIAAMKAGAIEYLVKPLDLDVIDLTVERSFHERTVRRRMKHLSTEAAAPYSIADLVGRDPSMIDIYKRIGTVARSRTSVLVRGETGTGKEVIARAIHFNSDDAEEPFVAVNCTAVPEGLLESELFGHLRGAFTGANADRRGRFELAGTGTIFLDEIGDTSLAFQAKLLRVLQEREFYAVGSERPRRTEARVIAATHRPLEALVREGRFREDLYFRLRVVDIAIPPLRERRGDIPALARHLLTKAARELHRDAELAPAALRALEEYGWPGNVRELENTLVRALALGRGTVITEDDLGLDDQGANASASNAVGSPTDRTLRAMERDHIERVLRECGNNKRRACKILGVSRPRLDRLLQRHEIGG